MEYRLSDGQFLLARVDCAKHESVRVEAKSAKEDLQRERTARVHAAVRQSRIESEQTNRDSLFSGVLDKATNLVFGEEEEVEQTTSAQLGGLTSSLGKTRDALNERGVKLASLSDMTADLADASRGFAKMAKELKDAQKGGLFW